MKRKRPETHEATHRGRKVRVTVPEDDEPDLFALMRLHLSPEAVAAIALAVACDASCLDGRTAGRDPERLAVVRQMRWFADGLDAVLGGRQARDRLVDELDL